MLLLFRLERTNPQENNVAHTPGPWFISEDGDRVLARMPEEWCGVDDVECVVALDAEYPGQDFEADARLIAAAPEMETLLSTAAAAIGWRTPLGVEILALLARIEEPAGPSE